MKPIAFEVSLEELVNALFPTAEERLAFAERFFTSRKGALSIREAAEYLGVHHRTLQDMDVPYKIVGGRRNYALRDLDAWLTKQPSCTGSFRMRARVVRRGTR